jgi:predicted acyl esterase
MVRSVRTVCIALVGLASLSGCTRPLDIRPLVPPATGVAAFAVHPSVEQVTVTGAEPHTTLQLLDATQRLVASGSSDDNGALIFREVAAGGGYRVQTEGASRLATAPFRVVDPAGSRPQQRFYAEQQLPTDFGYITTRDGTKLSAAVYLPGPPDAGPYPTVVEYSGYSVSNPTGSIAKSLCGVTPVACRTPDQPGSLLAAVNGYAVVAVNVRGTGCSGGAYDFFETLQRLDGYDVIETVAAQPWVLNHRVGMVGLSYPGIAQLFVAAEQPPSLAAIAPQSVFDDTARGVLAPGGLHNEGFAYQWANQVLDRAKPYGQGWEHKVVEERGDAVCAANQGLRGQNVDATAKAKANPYYTDAIAAQFDITRFADRIKVPVFLTGSFQDEQTGGRFPRLFDWLVNAPVKKFTMMNGAHVDGFAPQILTEWKTFLDIYVAGKVTGISPQARTLIESGIASTFDAHPKLPPDRWVTGEPLATIRERFEAEPPVRVLFENGAGDLSQPGAPIARWEQRFAAWPLPGTTAQPWYLHANGTLGPDRPPAGAAAARFVFAADLAKRTSLPGTSLNEAFHAQPPYAWEPDTATGAVVADTPPQTAAQTYVGSASADLWVRSSTDDGALGATLSIIAADGHETFVSSGVLRLKFRALDTDATALDPNPSLREASAATVKPGEWNQARVEIFPFAQVVRPGERLRLSIHSPGGDRPRWSWVVDDAWNGSTIDIGQDAAHPSRLVLSLVPSVEVGAPTAPPCGSLRGQPCRVATPHANTLVAN